MQTFKSLRTWLRHIFVQMWRNSFFKSRHDKVVSKQINPVATETTLTVVWSQMASQPSFQIPSVQWHIFKPFHLEYHMHVFLTIGPGDKEKHTRLFVVRADFVRYLFHYGWSKNIQYLWKKAIYKYKLAYGFRVSIEFCLDILQVNLLVFAERFRKIPIQLSFVPVCGDRWNHSK